MTAMFQTKAGAGKIGRVWTVGRPPFRLAWGVLLRAPRGSLKMESSVLAG